MGQVHAALSAGRRILTTAVACAACAVLWLLLSATSARADESAPPDALLSGVTGALPAPVGDTARPLAGSVDPVVQGAADATRRTTQAVRTTTDTLPAPALHEVVPTTTDTTDRLVDRVAGVASSVTDAVEQPPSPHSTAPARVPGSGAAADLAVPTAKSAVRAGVALALGHVVPFGSTDQPRGTSDGPVGLVPTSPWLAALVAGLLLVVLLRVGQRRPARGWLLPGAPSYPPGSSPD